MRVQTPDEMVHHCVAFDKLIRDRIVDLAEIANLSDDPNDPIRMLLALPVRMGAWRHRRALDLPHRV